MQSRKKTNTVTVLVCEEQNNSLFYEFGGVLFRDPCDENETKQIWLIKETKTRVIHLKLFSDITPSPNKIKAIK